MVNLNESKAVVEKLKPEKSLRGMSKEFHCPVVRLLVTYCPEPLAPFAWKAICVALTLYTSKCK